MPQIPVNDINRLVYDAEKAVKDGAYVAVGLGVLGFQRAQVRRRELAGRLQGLSAEGRGLGGPLGAQLGDLGQRLGSAPISREQLSGLARSLDERVAPARRQIAEQVDALEERLPANARNVVAGVRSALVAPEARLRAAVGLD